MTLVALALLVLGCAGRLVYESGPYSGRVVDAETNQPLAGAVVLAVWRKSVPIGGHMPEEFVDAVEVTTDMNGEFKIPRKEHTVIWGSMGEPRIIVFSPGYGFYPTYHVSPTDRAKELLRRHATIELPRWTTREERRRKLESLTNPVHDVPAARMPKLVELFRAEERALGVQPQSIGR
ncbi:MAG: hypothetical protein ACREM3_04900 [Candidatus Rokuibacteriota bacterium]